MSSVFVTQTKIHKFIWVDDPIYQKYNLAKSTKCHHIQLASFVVKRKISSFCKIKELRGQDGVFSNRYVPVGHVCGYMPGTYVSLSNYAKLTETEQNRNYSVEIEIPNDKIMIIPYDPMITMRYINDAHHPDIDSVIHYNCEYQIEYDPKLKHLPLLRIVCIRPIRSGAQLFINYGHAYWSSRSSNQNKN